MAENLSSSPLFAGRYYFQPVSSDWDRGRSGHTHLVFDVKKECLAVIKRAESKSQQAIEGLKNEVRALLDLQGLGVPELYDTGEAEYGSKYYFFIVIEYIDGIRVEKNLGSLSVDERAEILTQFFGLLAQTHQRGIVNGDIDLKHLFWRRDTEQLIVIDWGNVKLDINPEKKTEFSYDLARSAEIIYSLVTHQGSPHATGSIALPNESELIAGLLPLPDKFLSLCQWAPRTPLDNTQAPQTASELFEISRRWSLNTVTSAYWLPLNKIYTEFSRVDLDSRGGYARVAQVKTQGREDNPKNYAFKLMRHEIDYQKGLERFEDELKLLVEITQDKNAPPAITRIYDSGFAPVELSQNFESHELPNPKLRIYSTGTNIKRFLDRKALLLEKEPGRWLPFLVVDLAPYDDNLLRQIHHQPKEDALGLYRLPVGEVIAMAVQLIDVVEYLHKKHHRAYMDWKPEHLFWNGMNKQVKLIDWNVTVPLDEQPGEKYNIRDDTRLFCGAVLYISLTFIDPDDPTKSIGPRPTEEFQNPIPEIRRRYWTDNPNFYQRDIMLDGEIKQIIAKGLDPRQGFEMPRELKEELLNYAKQALGVSEAELMPGSQPVSQYFKTLAEVHTARHQFLQAQQSLIHVVEAKGANPEFTWLFESIKQALLNFPGS